MKNLFKLIIAAAAISCVASIYAVPTLTLFDGTTTIVVTDGSGSDQCSLSGCVTFNGSIGVWNLTIDTGLTKPTSGSPTNPDMDLSYLARSTASGSLKISWSDSGFTGNFNLTDFLGGSQTVGTGNSTLDQVFVNGTLVFSLGPFTAGSFSGSTSGPITLTATDVVTLVIQIQAGGVGTWSGDKNLVQTPDGGSAVALLGVALAGIESLRRLLRTRKA